MLRDYQDNISTEAAKLLQWTNIVYLSMEVRTGKTLTALATAQKFGAASVLFLTRKKAISSIKQQDPDDPEGDYDKLSPDFKFICINYERIHSLSPDYVFDLVICDEAHCLAQYPTPSERTKALKTLCEGKPIIYLSGTPSPESYSQLFHQFWISSFSPFKEWHNFYKWAAEFVTKKKKYFFNREINDYSCADQKKVEEYTKHLFITLTQDEAGFECPVKEIVVKVPMMRSTYMLADYLRKHKVHIGRDGQEVLADTAAKMMNKLHQIYSGTVIAENKEGIVFDTSKAKYIKEHFTGRKIAIFYKFQAEKIMLMATFGYNRITEDPQEFNQADDLIYISQVQAGREGVNLMTADCLVFLNIDFAAVSYWQARARLQDQRRTTPAEVYWLFAEGGIEEKIYAKVLDKKDYTLSHFKKDFSTPELSQSR